VFSGECNFLDSPRTTHPGGGPGTKLGGGGRGAFLIWGRGHPLAGAGAGAFSIGGPQKNWPALFLGGGPGEKKKTYIVGKLFFQFGPKKPGAPLHGPPRGFFFGAFFSRRCFEGRGGGREKKNRFPLEFFFTFFFLVPKAMKTIGKRQGGEEFYLSSFFPLLFLPPCLWLFVVFLEEGGEGVR